MQTPSRFLWYLVLAAGIGSIAAGVWSSTWWPAIVGLILCIGAEAKLDMLGRRRPPWS